MSPRGHDRDDPVEAEPLLAAEERDSARASIEIAETSNSEPERGHEPHSRTHGRRGFAARFQAQRRTTVVVLLAVVMFGVTTSGMLILLPMFRLVEDAICHLHYGKPLSEPIGERLCKIDEVQKQLAYLGGLSAMINSVVGIIATLPYGVLADRIGRKPCFILAYVGIVLGFGWGPLMLVIDKTPHVNLAIWGSLFFLIGGGIPVAMNSLNAMAADVSSETDRATGFLYISFGAVSGGLIGPVAAGLLMEHQGPWFPVLMVFCLTPLVLGLMVFVPETLPLKVRETRASEEQRSLAARLREAANELGLSLALFRNPDIALSLPAFLIQPALFAAYTSTLAQHISTYFGWSLAQTNYLLSPLGILQLVIILLLPRISALLTAQSGRFRRSVFAKDLLLAKISMLFLIGGALLEGSSRAVAVFIVGLTIGTLGSSHGPLCRAIATSYVEPQQTSRLYALITLLETGGALFGGPVLAWCFNVGLSRRGIWTGLPWFYVSGIVLVALLALTGLEPPKERATLTDPENETSGQVGYQSAEEQL